MWFLHGSVFTSALEAGVIGETGEEQGGADDGVDEREVMALDIRVPECDAERDHEDHDAVAFPFLKREEADSFGARFDDGNILAGNFHKQEPVRHHTKKQAGHAQQTGPFAGIVQEPVEGERVEEDADAAPHQPAGQE